MHNDDDDSLQDLHDAEEQAFEEAEETTKPGCVPKELKSYARMVHKVCGYYKWSLAEFRATPWWLIKELCAILDERQNDLGTFIGAEEAAMFKNLRRMFPPKSE